MTVVESKGRGGVFLAQTADKAVGVGIGDAYTGTVDADGGADSVAYPMGKACGGVEQVKTDQNQRLGVGKPYHTHETVVVNTFA